MWEEEKVSAMKKLNNMLSSQGFNYAHNDVYEMAAFTEEVKVDAEAKPAEPTKLEKVNHIFKWINENEPGVCNSIDYIIATEALQALQNDETPSPASMKSIRNLVSRYNIPSPVQQLKFKPRFEFESWFDAEDLRGANIVFTGFRSGDLVNELFQKYKANVEKTVRANIDILVTKNPDAEETTKVKKARRYGAQIVSLEELRNALNKN